MNRPAVLFLAFFQTTKKHHLSNQDQNWTESNILFYFLSHKTWYLSSVRCYCHCSSSIQIRHSDSDHTSCTVSPCVLLKTFSLTHSQAVICTCTEIPTLIPQHIIKIQNCTFFYQYVEATLIYFLYLFILADAGFLLIAALEYPLINKTQSFMKSSPYTCAIGVFYLKHPKEMVFPYTQTFKLLKCPWVADHVKLSAVLQTNSSYTICTAM